MGCTHDAVVQDTRDAVNNSDSSDMGSDDWQSIPGMEDPPEPVREPRTVPWNVSISDTDFEKLTAGYHQNDMDEAWEFFVVDPDPDGDVSVEIIRRFSWRVFWVLHLKRADTSGRVGAVTWGLIDYSEELAKMEVVQKCRRILGCGFEALPNYERRRDTGQLVIVDALTGHDSTRDVQ